MTAGFRSGDGEPKEIPQRITGAALDDLTTAEAEAAIDLRDAKIAARLAAEGPKGGVL